MTSIQVSNGCDLQRALRAARRLGCDVDERKGTGELFVRHASAEAPLRVSGHRKDAPRALTVLLRRLASGVA